MGRIRDLLYGAEDRDLKPIELPTYAGEAPVITDPVLEATPYNALRISDAYACIRVLADTVATLPVKAYRDTGSGRVLSLIHI